MKQTVAIVGTGYVGLSTAAILSNAEYKVYAVDVDSKKIDTLKAGKSHFFETGMDEFVKKGIESGNLIPTTDHSVALPEADIVFSCVGTPDLPDGSSNLEYIYQVGDVVAQYAKDGVVFVQKSTVPVGTGKNLSEYISSKNSQLIFSYVSNPEFLREGSAVFDTLNMDRLVVGSNDKDALDTITSIFSDVDKFSKTINHSDYSEYAVTYVDTLEDKGSFEDRIIRTNLESAELIKVTANAFLALKISFANSIAELCEQTDAHANEVMDGVGSDRRISRSFLYAGLGWGGGCFPKDVSGLIASFQDHNIDNPILNGAVEVNSRMPHIVLEKIKKYHPTKVTVLGLAFKPGTSDARKSQAIKLANLLVDQGYEVIAYDPQAMEEAVQEKLAAQVQLADSTQNAIQDAEVIVIATEWNEFKQFDWAQLQDVVIIDARNALDADAIKAAGLKYEGVGEK